MNQANPLHFPPRREVVIVLMALTAFLVLTALFIELRFEHVAMAGIYGLLHLSGPSTRKLAVALLPFVLFGLSYDWMRVYPNYMVNPIDVRGLYEAELSLFGLPIDGHVQTLCEFFAVHHHPVADFLAGVFYLCWVPVPIAFGIWLYFTGRRTLYLRFAQVFLLVNLLGFMGYYLHPAAPPWYVIYHGFEPVLGTPGNVAGLGRFDALVGVPIFESIYGRNANVFAAVPSLHSAYMVVALYYAVAGRCSRLLIALFSIIALGIWATAIYSAHHYVIDVLLGVGCALLGIVVFEEGLLRIPAFSRFQQRYARTVEN